MKRIGPSILCVACALGLHLVPFAGRAAADIPQFGYTVTDLGTLPGDITSSANDLNNAGQVVGVSSGETRSGNLVVHAFRWSASTGMKDLGNLGGSPVGLDPDARQSEAYGINNLGQVVGKSYGSSPILNYQPFLYSGGAMVNLSWPASDNAAFDINDLGQVVGATGMFSRAVLSSGAIGDVTYFLPGNPTSQALAINNAGGVVGWLMPFGQPMSAFRYSAGAVHNLGTFGGKNSEARDINDSGRIAGWAETGDGIPHAFLWMPPPYLSFGPPMKDLGLLPGAPRWASSKAYGINASTDVVGKAETAVGSNHAFVWSKGTMVDLNALISPLSGWVLTTAAAINDKGQICGTGTHNGKKRAFLLTPFLPPPVQPPGR